MAGQGGLNAFGPSLQVVERRQCFIKDFQETAVCDEASLRSFRNTQPLFLDELRRSILPLDHPLEFFRT